MRLAGSAGAWLQCGVCFSAVTESWWLRGSNAVSASALLRSGGGWGPIILNARCGWPAVPAHGSNAVSVSAPLRNHGGGSHVMSPERRWHHTAGLQCLRMAPMRCFFQRRCGMMVVAPMRCLPKGVCIMRRLSSPYAVGSVFRGFESSCSV